MSYPSRKIRRIRACTHQRPQRKEDQYAVSRRPIRRIEDIICEYSGRYQTLSLLQENSNTPANPADIFTLVIGNSYQSYITVNGKNAYELKGKFLDDLHNNAFSGTNRKDAVKHIE
ncbi:hypothetical protein Tco_0570209 [Tanacetum coccineum]